MNTLEQLANSKGTVSGAVGKDLAQKVLKENQVEILHECIDAVTFESAKPGSKHIRACAAKVVEIVAEKRPDLVSPHLEELLPALSVNEPQTRWMIIRVMGFCAHLNKPVSQKAIVFAKEYLDKKEGLCIASSADLFLGDLGSISKEDAQAVFPILEQSMNSFMKNEQDWILEALYKVFKNLDKTQQEKVLKFAENWLDSSRKSTQQRANKILKLAE